MGIKTIFLVIFGIMILIAVHEVGHFITARLLGVKVRRVSIGFGKILFRYHDRFGTEFVLSLFPLGGYVYLLDEREGVVLESDKPYSFNNQARYKQFIILIAGSLCNFLLSFLIYWGIYSAGITFPAPIIAKITPHSIAAAADLTSMQKIIRIDHRQVDNWQEIVFMLLMKYGSANVLDLTVQDLNTNQITTKRLLLKDWKWDSLRPDPIRSLGILPLSPKDKAWSNQFLQTQKYPIYAAGLPALTQLQFIIQLNAVVFIKILTGTLSIKVLSGPLSVLQIAAFASKKGILIYLLFLAFLSSSLGFMNLLPWPGLDGGRILFLIIETITRHSISYAWEVLLSRLGLIFLFVFIAQTVINDLLRMVN